MNDTLIHLDGVSFAYERARPILREAGLQLSAGQRIGLVGGNGSGKSTLLKIIVGLLRPSEGRVEILGRACTCEKDFREVRRAVGLLFQDSDDQLFCPTVEEDVAFGPLNAGATLGDVHAIVKRTLAEVGLEGFEKRVTYQLSGGEKRLAALAGVLAMRPRVLLLDEPVAGLDEEAQERITTLLESLPHEMIVVSHDPVFLRRVTERTYRLRGGGLDPVDSGGLTA